MKYLKYLFPKASLDPALDADGYLRGGTDATAGGDGADMRVSLVNDGPVTLCVASQSPE